MVVAWKVRLLSHHLSVSYRESRVLVYSLVVRPLVFAQTGNFAGGITKGSIRNALAPGNVSLALVTQCLATEHADTGLPLNHHGINVYPLLSSSTSKHIRRLMEDAEKGEKSKESERESPPLQIDPKWYVQHVHVTLLVLLNTDRT